MHDIARYIVEAVASGWQVRRFMIDSGPSEEFRSVVHARREVAEAYAATSRALEEYLASLDAREDSAELFDEWRILDDRYEWLAIELRDPPRDADEASIRQGAIVPRLPTYH